MSATCHFSGMIMNFVFLLDDHGWSMMMTHDVGLQNHGSFCCLQMFTLCFCCRQHNKHARFSWTKNSALPHPLGKQPSSSVWRLWFSTERCSPAENMKTLVTLPRVVLGHSATFRNEAAFDFFRAETWDFPRPMHPAVLPVWILTSGETRHLIATKQLGISDYGLQREWFLDQLESSRCHSLVTSCCPMDSTLNHFCVVPLWTLRNSENAIIQSHSQKVMANESCIL